jgi:sulfatase maturation enzyme AslB (radical SAM superfamily)
MYLQLTTRCNMTCAHCCFAATTRGDVMDRATYVDALCLARETGDHVTLGGGEPTVHPEFFAFLDLAIEMFDKGEFEMEPLVVTNGKRTAHAKKLLRYIEEERSVYVDLSLDEWHDPINPEVRAEFMALQRRRLNAWGSTRREVVRGGTRTANTIVSVGRAKTNGLGTSTVFGYESRCCCETPVVDPKGDLYSCGCKHIKLGTIWTPGVLDGYQSDFAHNGGYDRDLPRFHRDDGHTDNETRAEA